MATMTKHVGKMKDSGSRVAIMYRTLPDDKESALVVSTDNLPNIYHHAFSIYVSFHKIFEKK